MEYGLAGLPWFPCSCFESSGDQFKIAWRWFVVGINSADLKSDHFPLVTVQCLTGDATECECSTVVQLGFSLR